MVPGDVLRSPPRRSTLMPGRRARRSPCSTSPTGRCRSVAPPPGRGQLRPGLRPRRGLGPASGHPAGHRGALRAGPGPRGRAGPDRRAAGRDRVARDQRRRPGGRARWLRSAAGDQIGILIPSTSDRVWFAILSRFDGSPRSQSLPHGFRVRSYVSDLVRSAFQVPATGVRGQLREVSAAPTISLKESPRPAVSQLGGAFVELRGLAAWL